MQFCDVDLAIRVMELLNGVHFRGFPLNIRKAQGLGSADDFEVAEKRKNALMQSEYQHLSNGISVRFWILTISIHDVDQCSICRGWGFNPLWCLSTPLWLYLKSTTDVD